ncbi:MAG: hypothetical protein M3M84_07500 [Thermoproteota archaeon]|nr:hypothetical protein [Thermoproteota archaeon]
MSIISFSPFELTVIVLVITGIPITIENSSFILLYDELRPFDGTLLSSNKIFLKAYSCFAVVEHLIISLSGVLTRSPRMGSGPPDDALSAKVFCWQREVFAKIRGLGFSSTNQLC